VGRKGVNLKFDLSYILMGGKKVKKLPGARTELARNQRPIIFLIYRYPGEGLLGRRRRGVVWGRERRTGNNKIILWDSQKVPRRGEKEGGDRGRYWLGFTSCCLNKGKELGVWNRLLSSKSSHKRKKKSTELTTFILINRVKGTRLILRWKDRGRGNRSS